MYEKDNTFAWSNFLKQYSGSNLGRPIRLGTFQPGLEALVDNWIDCGSPFEEATVSTVNSKVFFQIVAGALTHQIADPVKLSVHFTLSGDEDGFDVVDRAGNMTILRFETHAAAAATA